MVFAANSQLPPINSPHPPRNVFVGYSHVKKNALDIIWDDPSIDLNNKAFKILGANIYRSYDSELGEFTKVNDTPIQIGYYEDSMTHSELTEDVSDKFKYRGNGPSLEWVFQTLKPMVKNDRRLLYANHSEDIEITIDGTVVPAARVLGEERLVQLITDPYLDKLTRELHNPVLPCANSVVTCKYLYNSNYIAFTRAQRIFYKLTLVTEECGETYLGHSEAVSPNQIEAWDYIWREASRRNRWILQQGGEDCWVRLRKWYGERCKCYSIVHGRSKVDCTSCWGTSIVGGYEGPFPFLMSPFDNEVKLDRVEQGLHTRQTSTLWSNLPPKLNTFDLIYRKSGEIYVVGYVKPTEVRGNSFLQQEFNASLLSRDRVEYLIPYAQKYDTIFVTDKQNIPDSQEVKGRTVTFENISY